MKYEIKNLDVNNEYLNLHKAVPFTLNKNTTGKEIYSWNTSPKFFPDDMKDAPIRIRYLMDNASRVGLGDLAMPDQPSGDKLIEDCHEITYEEFCEYFNSDIYNKQNTIWNVPKNYDAIFMTKETHDKILNEFGISVSLVYPAADCAVVRFYDRDKQIIGLTHSDAVHTTENIIGKMIDYSKKHFLSDLDNCEIYVGAFANDGWYYDSIPSFALKKDSEGNALGISDEWIEYIEDDDGRYLINYGDKIYEQIKDTGIDMENVYFDPDNTLFNDNYFSHSRSYSDKNYREGRNLMGITFDSAKIVSSAEENGVVLR